MAESIITLGIGSAPGSITPFLLTGLTASSIADMTASTISGQGSVGQISGTGSVGQISGSGGV